MLYLILKYRQSLLDIAPANTVLPLLQLSLVVKFQRMLSTLMVILSVLAGGGMFNTQI